jgi:hypothetical protein
VLAHPGKLPRVGNTSEAMLVRILDHALVPGRRYRSRHCTKLSAGSVSAGMTLDRATEAEGPEQRHTATASEELHAMPGVVAPEARPGRFGQKAVTVLLTGLSGAGKEQHRTCPLTAPHAVPESPDLTLPTDTVDIEESVGRVLALLRERGILGR